MPFTTKRELPINSDVEPIPTPSFVIAKVCPIPVNSVDISSKIAFVV